MIVNANNALYLGIDFLLKDSDRKSIVIVDKVVEYLGTIVPSFSNKQFKDKFRMTSEMLIYLVFKHDTSL